MQTWVTPFAYEHERKVRAATQRPSDASVGSRLAGHTQAGVDESSAESTEWSIASVDASPASDGGGGLVCVVPSQLEHTSPWHSHLEPTQPKAVTAASRISASTVRIGQVYGAESAPPRMALRFEHGSELSILTTMGPLVSQEHSPLGPFA
jgi:hypothetical protein